MTQDALKKVTGSVNAQAESVNEQTLPPYSVVMSIYVKDVPEWFEQAVDSMLTQTFPPDEIIIVQDGPVSRELHERLEAYVREKPEQIRSIVFEENRGLAEAMCVGIRASRNEWIARMDSDDISDPRRCERELRKALEVGADIVGCDSEEFIGTIDNGMSKRVFPESHEELIRFSKHRVPFCHPSVMMKKSAVLRAGNYRSVGLVEDYDLFVRMLAVGAVGCTVKEILFHVRVNTDFYNRRGGWAYVRTLLNFNVELLKMKWMSPADFVVRSCGNILLGMAPVAVRTWLYRRMLRK